MQNLNKILAESNACGYTYQLLMGQRILILKAPGMTIGIVGVSDVWSRYDLSVVTPEHNLTYENATLKQLLNILDEPLQALY